MKCTARILESLRFKEKTRSQICSDLFVRPQQASEHIAALMREGRVYRKWFHNKATGLPDYLYSSVKWPPRYPPAHSAPPADLVRIMGDWDATDMRGIKK